MTRLAELTSEQAQRIAIIKPSAFGDVVQALPLLPAIRERFPRASIAWIVRSELAGLLEGHPHLDEVIPYSRSGGLKGMWHFLRSLRKRRFDLVFDLQGLFRTGLMTWASGAPLRVGLESAREGSHWTCNVILPDTSLLVPAHMRYWRVAEELGVGYCARSAIVATTAEHDQWAAKTTSALGEYVLAVQPGARWGTKRWPVEQFAVVVARAARRFGLGAVILGSGNERPVTKQLEFLVRRFFPGAKLQNLAGETSVKQLAALLKSTNVCLTNDSGPMHLAAAMGTPVVGVFTCTEPRRSGPQGDQHRLVTTTLPCRNCYKRRCPLSGDRKNACLTEITTDRVWEVLEEVIREIHPARSAA